MTLIENYLCNSERVLYRLSRKNFRGVPEELAATNLRIIHAKGDRFHDIKYGYLASIGDYSWQYPKPEFFSERPGDIKDSYADISLAKKVLGFDPKVTLNEGLREIIESKNDQITNS